MEKSTAHGPFRDKEIVEIQGKRTVLFGGRMRVLHETHENVTILTEIQPLSSRDYVVIKATVSVYGDRVTQYMGHGTANEKADAKLGDSLVELAETRAIARAARHAGIGLEYNDTTELQRSGPGRSTVAPSPDVLVTPRVAAANAKLRASQPARDPRGGQ